MILIVQKDKIDSRLMEDMVDSIIHYLENFGIKEDIEGDYYSEHKEIFGKYSIPDKKIKDDDYKNYSLVFFIGFNPIFKYPVTNLVNGIQVTRVKDKTFFADILIKGTEELLFKSDYVDKEAYLEMARVILDRLRKQEDDKRFINSIINNFNRYATTTV